MSLTYARRPRKKNPSNLRWDSYTSSASESSKRWASTDRGWLFLLNHPDARGADDTWANERRAVGNYLKYERAAGPRGEHILATAYLTRLDPSTRAEHSTNLGSTWVNTVEAAKKWIEGKVKPALAAQKKAGTYKRNPSPYARGAYVERVKLPKWNGKPMLIEAPAPRIQAEFPGISKAGHLKEVERACVKANIAAHAYNRAMRAAYTKYGTKGGSVSGIGQEHFPKNVKTHLIKALDAFQAAQDAAQLHYKASGARTPFYKSVWVDKLVKAGGYGLGQYESKTNPKEAKRLGTKLNRKKAPKKRTSRSTR